MRSALIIGTEVATNGLESGASIRVDSIKDLLTKNGYHVDITSRAHAKNALTSDWDLVVLVSFSTSKFLRLARKKAQTIWFDPTDSWTLTRFSLFRKGDVKQILLLVRDLFWIWTAPNIDLITFITRRDSTKEQAWWKYRSSPFIFPVQGLDREVELGNGPRLVFIGDGSYGPNKNALTFLSHTLKYLPSTLNIHVFGTGVSIPNSKFIIHGYVPRSELYSARDIHLAPITMGGGLKLKVAIPLWNGLHVVSTEEAAVGFKNSDSLKIANTPKQFADAIMNSIEPERLETRFKPLSAIYIDDQTVLVDRWLAGLSLKE
jgi:hypothetical protein